MELGLNNKTALVLGSSRGIGLGIVKKLIQEGAHVGICGRQSQQLQGLAQTLSTNVTSRVLPFTIDLFEPQSAAILFEQATQSLGQIDILVNNASGPPTGLTTEITTEQWQKYFSSMVVRLIELTNFCLPFMRERKWGRILNISSSSVVQPIPGLAISNVLRPSLLTWGKTLASEVAKDGITVNTILPGKISTERLHSLNQTFAKKHNKSIEEFERELMQTIPMKRFGRIEELADVAVFYLSERASYLTGSSIRVDGGAITSI